MQLSDILSSCQEHCILKISFFTNGVAFVCFFCCCCCWCVYSYWPFDRIGAEWTSRSSCCGWDKLNIFVNSVILIFIHYLKLDQLYNVISGLHLREAKEGFCFCLPPASPPPKTSLSLYKSSLCLPLKKAFPPTNPLKCTGYFDYSIWNWSFCMVFFF